MAALLTVVHGLALFAALNGLAQVALTFFPEDSVSLTYGDHSFALVYPGKTREQVRQLLVETWTRPDAFEPFTDFRESPFHGRYVNVHPAGFRISRGQGPWPPDSAALNVFVFGGSTTFGYGVADDETIVSALQVALNQSRAPDVRCYNFGRGGYYSSQERILFEELLDGGVVPRVAVFIDGLNEFAFEAPEYTTEIQKFVSSPGPSALRLFYRELPLVRWIARKEYGGRPHRPAARRLAKYDDTELLDHRIERYLTNRRLIAATAAALGVRTLFVWQPVPTYKYDLRYHLFGSFHFGINYYSAFGYARMAERLGREPPDPEFLWAADMQEGVREPLYVDQIHYTAVMSELLAEEIAATLKKSGALAPRPLAQLGVRGSASWSVGDAGVVAASDDAPLTSARRSPRIGRPGARSGHAPVSPVTAADGR